MDYRTREDASTYQKSHTGHAWSGHIPEPQSAHKTNPQNHAACVYYEKAAGLPLLEATARDFF